MLLVLRPAQVKFENNFGILGAHPTEAACRFSECGLRLKNF